MKHLLFDLSCLQLGPKVGGAAAYAKRVLEELVQYPVTLYAVYDIRYCFHPVYEIPKFLEQHEIPLINIQGSSIAEIVQQYNINTVFLPLGQYARFYNLKDIPCRVVIAIHDIFNLEENDINLDLSIQDPLLHKTRLGTIKHLVNNFIGRKKVLLERYYRPLYELMSQPNTEVMTVSHYSQMAMMYYIPCLVNKEIKFFYSPTKEVPVVKDINNSILRQLISENQRFFFMISANRYTKNPTNVIKAFRVFAKRHPEYLLVTVGYPKSVHPNHVALPILTESDLEYAYKHAFALIFASFFEGFGYPPIEAMRYGTPVLASNVTSIPEVCGDAATYFSPFYPADIYRAMEAFITADYEEFRQQSYNRAKEMSDLQHRHLDDLMKFLLQ